MRYFLSKRVPPFQRILLIESGSRDLLEDLLRGLYDVHPGMTADLLTCYAGQPKHFRSDRGRVYRVTDYHDPASRRSFYAELAANRYNIAGMICSAEPIMTKWKWMLAARLPAKVFILNENGDYFWLHRENAAILREFALVRAGLSGAGAVRTIGRLLLFPFAVIFLLLYAFQAHARRMLRLKVSYRST
jgi:hypothetical protein